MAAIWEYVGAAITTNLVLAVTAAGAGVRARHQTGGRRRETWTRWWYAGATVGAIAVAVSFLLAPSYMAGQIGYRHTPFQFEVACANLGFAVLCALSVRRPELRLPTALGYGVFLWGALGGHVYQLVVNGDDAAGNVGGIWIYDLLVPAVMLALSRPGRTSGAAAADGVRPAR